jgi:hypothetical protein
MHEYMLNIGRLECLNKFCYNTLLFYSIKL